MNAATTYIAESIVKAVGIAGIEAMAMKNAIYSIWKPLAEEFAEEVIYECIHFDEEDTRPEYAGGIIQQYRTRMTTDFVEKALPFIEEYVGHAWDRGREDAFGYTLSGLLEVQKSAFPQVVEVASDRYPSPSNSIIYHWEVNRWILDLPHGERIDPAYLDRSKFQKDQESIITDLVSLTGSTKANVQRTVKRWFETTQGQYFDRFIVPETARLLSYEEGTSLRSIGERYKEFVKAEGYWSSVSEFNTETSKVFSQVQALQEMNINEYTIVAILDEKTCDVCQHMHGTTWSVEQAVIKVYDMLISEAEEAQAINPFPPRSTPKDFEDPQESPYNLPPFHPRCRCNVRSSSRVAAMPQEILARPFDAGPRPTNHLLTGVYRQYVNAPSKKEVQAMIDAGQIRGSARSLTRVERKVAEKAWNDMPVEVKKWSIRNKNNFEILVEEGEEITSRVEGNRIFVNAKFFDSKRYGPQPLQHELRHALVNSSALDARGGGTTVWRELVNAADDPKGGWRSPTHVNTMYQLNGNQGLRAATAASDEFIAMIGDHYRPGMSLDELITSVRHKSYGIDVSDKIGSTVVSKSSRWSAREAKNATSYWWYIMDIDNNTLLTKKQMLSKVTHKPSTAAVRAVAINNEVDLRDSLRAAGIKNVHQEGDNAPFDVWIGADPAKWYAGTSKVKPSHVIEVKTIVRAKNDKITMHGDSLARKRKEARKFGKRNTKVHTIVFDERTGKMYYRNDVGSFRLSSMEEVSIEDIQRKFGGDPAPSANVLQLAPSAERLAAIEDASPRVKTKPSTSLHTKGTIDDGNVNEVRIVTVGKGKKKYIFKPVEGESFFAKESKDEILEEVNKKFKKAKVTRLEDLTDEHWEYLEEFDHLYYEQVLRQSIDNFDVTLSQREVFALDVAHRLDLDNEYARVPKFLVAKNEDGSMAGVLIEFIEKSEVESIWHGPQLTQEERYQMAVFDYLIGNTDRHNSNWMRQLKDSKPVYIDHGYSMPGQSLDMGGITELRLQQAEGIYESMEYDMDPDFIQELAVKVQNFVDKDASRLAKSYGFSYEEIDAMLRRGDSVAERMREASFSLLMKKHVDDFGMYGADDSYIGG